MLGLSLFLGAVRAVIDDLPAALRLSLVPSLAVGAAAGALEAAYGDLGGLAQGAAPDPDAPAGAGIAVPPGLLAGVLLVLAANLVAISWVAVGWHRFRLLGEAPRGWVPRFDGGLVLGYLGRSVLLGLAVGLIALGAGTVVAVLLLPLLGPGAQVVVLGAMALVGMVLFYRLGVILPAGAVGRPMGFGEAMRTTAGHSRTAVVLSLLSLALAALMELPPLLDAAPAGGADGARLGVVGFAYGMVTQWVALLVGASTLTAFYAHVTGSRTAGPRP